MKVQDMIALMANYTVTLEDGSKKEFVGTLFMLWIGLHEFLKVAYPTWIQIDYNCEFVCSGTIMNRDWMNQQALKGKNELQKEKTS